MEKSFGLMFFLKKPKNYVDGCIHVYMRITVDNISCDVSTKQKCEPEKWNTAANRMIGKNEHTKAFNSYLDTLKQKVFEAKRKLIEFDKKLTAENIKFIITGKEINQHKHMLTCIFEDHNKKIETLLNHEFAPGTH
jgi:hypothetical protein